MNKSIEIAGTLLSLDDVAAISNILNSGVNYPDYFVVVYKSHQGESLSFSVIDRYVEGESHFIRIGSEIKIYVKNISLTEIRNKIVEICKS